MTSYYAKCDFEWDLRAAVDVQWIMASISACSSEQGSVWLWKYFEYCTQVVWMTFAVIFLYGKHKIYFPGMQNKSSDIQSNIVTLKKENSDICD